jgi:hypothetical protein
MKTQDNIIGLKITEEGLNILNLEIMKKIGSPAKYIRSNLADYHILGKKGDVVVIGWKEKDFYKNSMHADAFYNGLKQLDAKGIPYIYKTGSREILVESLLQ